MSYGDDPSLGVYPERCRRAQDGLGAVDVFAVSQDGCRADSLTAQCDYGIDENRADAEKATKPTLPASQGNSRIRPRWRRAVG